MKRDKRKRPGPGVEVLDTLKIRAAYKTDPAQDSSRLIDELREIMKVLLVVLSALLAAVVAVDPTIQQIKKLVKHLLKKKINIFRMKGIK